MGRKFPKPWFREDRKLWYVELAGRQINLGENRDEAFRRYHEIMAQHRPGTVPNAPNESPAVATLLERFLLWVKANRSEGTLTIYNERLQSFLDSLTNQLLTVADFRPHHVQAWVDSHAASWADGTKRGRIMAVQTAMKWAKRQGYIAASPIEDLDKPGAGRRENPVMPEDWQKVVAVVRTPTLRDLLTVTWETGARPQEMLRVERRHVDLEGKRWIFQIRGSKGKKRPRVVHLTDAALEICRRLCQRHPKGPIFRNQDGVPWTTSAVNCAMQRLAHHLGRKVALVDFRHGFGTRMLKAGNDPITVAALMGHKDPSMLAKVYSHVHADAGHLRDALNRGRGS
jgi:integrase